MLMCHFCIQNSFMLDLSHAYFVLCFICFVFVCSVFTPPFKHLSLAVFVSFWLKIYLLISPPKLLSPPLGLLISLSPFIILPLFDIYVKGFYALIEYLAKKYLFISIIILRETSQLSNALSWMFFLATRCTRPSNVERLGSFFKIFST